MRFPNGSFRTIPQSPVITSTCLTFVGVLTLATYVPPTRKIFVQNFTRSTGVEERRGLIVSDLIGESIIVGFTHPLDILGKFGGNS
jgi:hypothetical protein